MFEYRIAKYDPTLRDKSGAYTKDDWISFDDIGKEFDGVVLAREEYLRVENSYIESVIGILDEAGIKELQIKGLENSKQSVEAANLSDGDYLKGSELGKAFRNVPREKFWCRFENDDTEYVHFGWDYYMYVGVQTYCESAIKFVESKGLFVEEFESPYKPEQI
jgi:hypothetical protein